jgi:hypothetical protein
VDEECKLDESLGWLLQSVDYGRYCERKRAKASQSYASESLLIIEEKQTMTDRLIKIQKLVNLMADISDEDQDLRYRVKGEVDR